MAATSGIYNSFRRRQLGSASLTPINFETDIIKVVLCTSSYTPDIDTHDYLDDVTNEISPTGTYVAGGMTLANKATSQDNTDNEGVFDADDVTITGATTTFRIAVIYKYTGTSATSPLIGYIDFGTNIIATAGTFTIPWLTEGILNL
jgi:hypothetical protein